MALLALPRWNCVGWDAGERDKRMRFRSAFSIVTACAMLPPFLCGAQPAAGQNSGEAGAPTTVVYRNTQYGFCFLLPASWQGFSVVADRWRGEEFSSGATVRGPQLLIRHPKWTSEHPYQDIPIMVFTPKQWEQVESVDLSVSAAPIGPAELGHNGHYVFALPPRWIGFTDALGQDEVESWMQRSPLQAPCGNKSAPTIQNLP